MTSARNDPRTTGNALGARLYRRPGGRIPRPGQRSRHRAAHRARPLHLATGFFPNGAGSVMAGPASRGQTDPQWFRNLRAGLHRPLRVRPRR